ncbi:MAG: hypothetical protein ACW99U_15105 [Candidatus Thorarchaeota archaeon]|jgi:hypothetical protein
MSESDREIDIHVSSYTVEEFYQLMKDRDITSIVIRRRERKGREPVVTEDIEETWVQEGLDMSSLVDLPDLSSVKILGNMRLMNMKSLRRCGKLRRLHLERVPALDLSGLKNCDSLEHLKVIPYHTRYIDLSPLDGCRSLKSIDVSHKEAPPRGFLPYLIGVRLPSSRTLEYLNLSKNSFVSKFMLDIWPGAYKHLIEERIAKGTIVLKKKQLLDLSQLKHCSSLREIDLEDNDRLFAVDLSGLAGLNEVTVTLTRVPLRKINREGFTGKISFPFSFKEGSDVDKKGMHLRDWT